MILIWWPPPCALFPPFRLACPASSCSVLLSGIPCHQPLFHHPPNPCPSCLPLYPFAARFLACARPLSWPQFALFFLPVLLWPRRFSLPSAHSPSSDQTVWSPLPSSRSRSQIRTCLVEPSSLFSSSQFRPRACPTRLCVSIAQVPFLRDPLLPLPVFSCPRPAFS